MMQVAIYRSTKCTVYPEETLSYCFDFEPIVVNDQARGDPLLGWIKNSGSEPFAVIEAPDGSRLTKTQEGWELLIPDASCGICADEAYDLAVDQMLGLILLREMRAHREFS